MGVLDRYRLDGDVAVVTGASSGLGVAFADALAEAGADLVLAARREERLEETRARVEEAGRRAIVVPTDVSDPDDCRALADAAAEAFGHIDIVVNNAGLGTAVPPPRESPDQFTRVIDVNLNGCYWVAQACIGQMRPGGRIINISSLLALITAGMPQAAYSASKAGLLGLTRDLAQQWTGRKGVRVNALLPGFFPSEMTDEYPDGYLQSQTERILVGRAGDPEELAAALLFLASDASSYVTGQCLVVDGGRTIG
jgi:NAD(P)-dependent dehydrogenase (short-subunit alcohol dehydrogenase family)